MGVFGMKWSYFLTIVFVLGVTSVASAVEPHRMHPGDLALSIDNKALVSQGENIFSEKCSACHGGRGVGTGRAPCLTCGKFMFRGNTNAEIFETVYSGTPRDGSRGGKMGAFSSILSNDEIISVVTFLRATERDRIASGEIADPYNVDDEAMKFPE